MRMPRAAGSVYGFSADCEDGAAFGCEDGAAFDGFGSPSVSIRRQCESLHGFEEFAGVDADEDTDIAEASVAQTAGVDLDDAKSNIDAAIENKDYAVILTVIKTAMAAPCDEPQFVPLPERPAGQLLQHCCKRFEADCAAEHAPALWARILAAAKYYFAEQVANVPNEMEKIKKSIAEFTGSSGHEGMYDAEMGRLLEDADFKKYLEQFDSLHKSLPEAPLQQQTSDVCAIYQHSKAAASMFEGFMEELKKGSQCVFTMAPHKKIYRMGEKIGVRAVGGAKEPWDGATITDAVRGTVQIPEGQIGRGRRFLNLLQGADPRLGGEYQTASTFKINIVGIKNRWPPNEAQKGGWRCGQVYFSFLADDNAHVCELQIVHEAMESVRKGIGNPGYQYFGSNRSALQLKKAWAAQNPTKTAPATKKTAPPAPTKKPALTAPRKKPLTPTNEPAPPKKVAPPTAPKKKRAPPTPAKKPSLVTPGKTTPTKNLTPAPPPASLASPANALAAELDAMKAEGSACQQPTPVGSAAGGSIAAAVFDLMDVRPKNNKIGRNELIEFCQE